MSSENQRQNLFKFRLYDFEKPEELAEIFELCFGQKFSSRYFNWKYLDNPAGKAIAFVAEHNNHIAAFYGVIPEYYLVNNKKEIVYQSMDTMTHPEYRKSGLFTKLANLTYE